jgi:cytoskeleton protein RodZ
MFEIGNSLRAARERQGFAHSEIELATKIRAKYLRALEEEDFDTLPGDAYTRGFLRTYADYLGLDGEIYVEEYASRFLASRYDEVPARPERRRRRRRERTLERRAVVLVLGGIALLTALVFVAWRYGGTSTPVPALSTTQNHRQAASGASLVLRGVGRGTYVVVRSRTASGRLLLQGTVGRGEIDRFAGRRFYLAVRRPAALRVTLGGRAVVLPSGPNLHVLVTPQHTVRLQG